MARSRSSITGGNDIGTLYHKDHRAFRRACSVAHTFGHNEPLTRRKIDDAIFEIDQKAPIQHEKEFIDFVVLMPVILALNHRHPDD